MTNFSYNLGDKTCPPIGAYTNNLLNLTMKIQIKEFISSEYDYNWTNIEIGMMIPIFNNLNLGFLTTLLIILMKETLY